jgi:hypothetical protein
MTLSRIFSLVLAGVVIAGLCVYRATRPPRPIAASALVQRAYPPRGWELPYKLPGGETTSLMKFDRYLGRQPLVIVFTGGETMPGDDPALQWLGENYDRVRDEGYEAIGVTPFLPAVVARETRQRGKAWPFPVVSDVELQNPVPAPVHRRWGLDMIPDKHSAPSESPSPGVLGAVFLIDRAGYVEYENSAPRPLKDPIARFEEMFQPR